MNNQERAYVLQTWGFTPIQASFLVTAALGSGYFLRRQFHYFSGSADRTQGFLLRLLKHGYAREIVLDSRQRLFHLNYAPMYTAIGDPACRNRRLHGYATIRARVMALDFLLGLPQYSELLSVPDYRRHLDENSIPRKLHCRPKFPVVLDDRENLMQPPLVFTYVDAGAGTNLSFRKWMQSQAALFRLLPAMKVGYICAFEGMVPAAQRVYEDEILKARPDDFSARDLDLLRYFESRRDYENARLTQWDQAGLMAFRDARARFPSAEYDAQYERWKEEGAAAVIDTRQCAFLATVISGNYSGLVHITASNISGGVSDPPRGGGAGPVKSRGSEVSEGDDEADSEATESRQYGKSRVVQMS